MSTPQKKAEIATILQKLDNAYLEMKTAGAIHRRDTLKHIIRLNKRLKKLKNNSKV